MSPATPDMRLDLPEDSLFLLPLFPRSRWFTPDTHPTAFRWLQAHAWFRETLEAMLATNQRGAAATIDGHALFASVLQPAHTFLTVLDAHHHSESEIYFPRLAAEDARIRRGIDVLESDHHRINSVLLELAACVRSMSRAHRTGQNVDASSFFDLLGHLKIQLDRHLRDEEDLVIPFLSLQGDPVTGERAVTSVDRLDRSISSAKRTVRQ